MNVYISVSAVFDFVYTPVLVVERHSYLLDYLSALLENTQWRHSLLSTSVHLATAVTFGPSICCP